MVDSPNPLERQSVMPPSSAAARCLALAVIGVGAVSFAAHGQNVVAFNPYSGAGLQGGPLPQYGSATIPPTAGAAAHGPTTGPAFNPWSSRGQTTAASPPSLARALVVRNYLIDKGVRSKIEIASIVDDGGERVEILVPNT
jgi:hypothetical protein